MDHSQLTIRQLNKEVESLPYNLLLLADETREAINRYIHQSHIYIVQYKLETIAVYALYPIDKSTIEIKNIAVAKSHQGKGIGQQLLYDAINKATTSGYKTLLIGTGDASTQQLYLYQKVGFKRYAIKERFFLDNYPEPIYENGRQLKDMIMLRRELN